jgi:hypothetical protein
MIDEILVYEKISNNEIVSMHPNLSRFVIVFSVILLIRIEDGQSTAMVCEERDEIPSGKKPTITWNISQILHRVPLMKARPIISSERKLRYTIILAFYMGTSSILINATV